MTKAFNEMTLQSRRSLRRNRGDGSAFALHRGQVVAEKLVNADRHERAVIRAPTALEVVQRDQSRDLSP